MKIEETIDKYLTEKIFQWSPDNYFVCKWRGQHEVHFYADPRGVQTTTGAKTINLEIDRTKSRGKKFDEKDFAREWKSGDRQLILAFTEGLESVIKQGFQEVKEINYTGTTLQVVLK